VTAVARRLAGDDEAEDVAQEAFLQAYLALSRLREPERFGSWVAAIAVNLARMRLRRRREIPLEPWLEGGRLAPPTEPPRADDDLEFLELVRSAVELLPARERDAVLMYYVDGLSSQEIAALLGELSGTVRVRLHRARRRLRARLAPHLEPRKEPGMVEVTLEDVIVRVLTGGNADVPRLANQRVRIVLLKERDGERVVPIWVGPPEGDALALQLGGESLPRPLTADLMARLVEATGASVERVAVSSLREDTFYATITLAIGDDSREIDARPSDALNLAARVGAPIYVDRPIVDKCGIAPDQLDREAARVDVEVPEEPSEWRSLTPELVKSLYLPPPARR
jgi:RNA polymerase sigma factor (sigma-70 family)